MRHYNFVHLVVSAIDGSSVYDEWISSDIETTKKCIHRLIKALLSIDADDAIYTITATRYTPQRVDIL